MGMSSPSAPLRLPGPTATTFASLICWFHEEGSMGQLWVSGAHFGVGNGVEASESSRTLDTADSGNRIPPTLLVGATIFSTNTRSSRGIRRLAISGLFAPCEVMTSRARRLGRGRLVLQRKI